MEAELLLSGVGFGDLEVGEYLHLADYVGDACFVDH